MEDGDILDLPFSIFVHETMLCPFSRLSRDPFLPVQSKFFWAMDKVRLIRHVLCQCCRWPVYESATALVLPY
jgi:hypothetical protein